MKFNDEVKKLESDFISNVENFFAEFKSKKDKIRKPKPKPKKK